MPLHLRPRLTPRLLVVLAALLVAGCQSSSNITQLSSDTYMVSIHDRTGAFEMDPPAYKHRAINEAMVFADSHGKAAVPVSMVDNSVGGVAGQSVRIDYTFRLVDKNDPRAKLDTAPPVEKKPDHYEELMKLDELRKKGVLTEAEFNAEKQKILNQTK